MNFTGEPLQIFSWLVLIVIVVLAIYVPMKFSSHRQKTVSGLKDEYDAALRSGDKRAALEAGRRYYSAQRGNGKLTIYDEQAIANDLNAM